MNSSADKSKLIEFGIVGHIENSSITFKSHRIDPISTPLVVEPAPPSNFEKLAIELRRLFEKKRQEIDESNESCINVDLKDEIGIINSYAQEFRKNREYPNKNKFYFGNFIIDASPLDKEGLVDEMTSVSDQPDQEGWRGSSQIPPKTESINSQEFTRSLDGTDATSEPADFSKERTAISDSNYDEVLTEINTNLHKITKKIYSEVKEFKASVSARLLPILCNLLSQAQALPYRDKLEVVQRVNTDLQRYGLTIEDAEGHRFALEVDTKGNPKTELFALTQSDSGEVRKILSDPADLLLEFKLKADSFSIPPPQSPKSVDSKPHDYLNAAAELTDLTLAFRSIISEFFRPIINDHLKQLPVATYDDKRILVNWVNDELRRLGLAIRCPKTGLPSSMIAGAGDDPKVGRFQFRHQNGDGKEVRTFSSVKLPNLELMPATGGLNFDTKEQKWVDRSRPGPRQKTSSPPK